MNILQSAFVSYIEQDWMKTLKLANLNHNFLKKKKPFIIKEASSG